MLICVFVYLCIFNNKITAYLAKKTHLTNKKYIRRSLKNLFANVRPWICKFAWEVVRCGLSFLAVKMSASFSRSASYFRL